MARVPPDPQALLAHADFVRALAHTLVRDAARADDIAQETWVAALEHPPRTAQSPRGWLLTGLRNFARRFARAEVRRARWEGAAARPEPVPSTHEIVAREETRRRVVEAVLALEEPCRSAVILRFYEDLPPRAIAKRLGLPVETVRTRLKRGLALLRGRLDREWGGDRSAWCAALAPIALKKAGIVPALLGGVAMKASSKAAIAAALVLGVAVVFWPRNPRLLSEVSLGPGGAAAPASLERASPRAGESGIDRQDSAWVPGLRPAERRAIEKEGPRVTGLVVDRGGLPVPRARVFSVPANLRRTVRLSSEPETDPVQNTETDAEGRFEVPLGGRSPSHNLFVEAEGFSARVAASLRSGDDVKIVLGPARGFAGTVSDLDGHPVAGATVRWSGLMLFAQVERRAVSRADGSYRIEGITSPGAAEGTGSGLAWWLEAEANGFAPLRIAGPVSPEPEGDVRRDLFLIRGATLRGRVVDAETGSAIGGASAYLWSWEGQSHSGDFPTPYDPVRIGETLSAADGAFVFENVPAAGFHRRASYMMGSRGLILGYVGAKAPGYATGFEQVLYVKDGEVTDATVRLWHAARVRGRVLDRSGKPVAGVPVSASGLDGGGRWTGAPLEGVGFPKAETDAEGKYLISGVPVGLESAPVTVSARALGSNVSAKVEVRLRAGEEAEAPDIPLKTDPCAELLVADDQGRPVWGANAYGPGLDSAAFTDESGRARVFYYFEERSGERVLVVRGPGHSAARTQPFIPSEENPPEVRVVLGPAHRIRGTTVLPYGKPAAGVDLYALHPAIRPEEIARARVNWGDWKEGPGLPGPYVLGFATSREDGSFEVRDLPEGPYTLVTLWRHPRGEGNGSEIRALLTGIGTDASEVVFHVPPEEEEDRAKARLEGTVTDAATGAPLLDFEIVLKSDRRAVSGEKTAPGKFRVEAPPGTWKLTVSAEGYAAFVREGMEVGPETVPEPISVVLDGGTTVRGVVRGIPPELELELAFRREGERDRLRAKIGKDGAYRLRGFRPGKYQVALLGGPVLPPGDPGELVIPEWEREVGFDLEVVPAGKLELRLRSSRLSIGATPLRLEIRDRADRVVRTVNGTTDGLLFFTLLPGEYRLRLEASGADPQEKKVAIEAGTSSELEIEIP